MISSILVDIFKNIIIIRTYQTYIPSLNSLKMSSPLKKTAIGTGAILGTGLLLSTCDPLVNQMAKTLAGDEPVMPVRVPAERGPVHVAIGMDGSVSKIKQKLPDAISATADFVRKSTILKAGDTVNFCEVGGPKGGAGEPAKCRSYEVDSKNEALLADIEDTKAIHWSTYLRPSLVKMLEGLEEPCVAGLWTDGLEETDTPPTVDSGSCDVNIFIPDASYREKAQALCGYVEGQCKVVLATTGEDVEKALNEVVSSVQKEAQEAADEKADSEHADAMKQYEKKQAKLKEKAQNLKRKARILLGSIVTLVTGALGSLFAYLNRPRAKGFLYIRKPKGAPMQVAFDTFDQKKIDLRKDTGRPDLPDLNFSATWKGELQCNGQTLEEGGQFLGEGVYYCEQPLKGAEKKAVYAQLKRTDRAEVEVEEEE